LICPIQRRQLCHGLAVVSLSRVSVLWCLWRGGNCGDFFGILEKICDFWKFGKKFGIFETWVIFANWGKNGKFLNVEENWVIFRKMSKNGAKMIDFGIFGKK
jgi:hypothetical protein